MPAAALATDVAVLGALANDVSFDVVFARPLAQRPRRGSRGGLVNQWWVDHVLRGFEEANRRGMLTIGGDDWQALSKNNYS